MSRQQHNEINRQPILGHYLFQSDFYCIKDLSFCDDDLQATQNGFNDCFCFSFIRQGHFPCEIASTTYDLHTGYILLEKPDCEYKLRSNPGGWSIFNFTETFYRQLMEEYCRQQCFFFTSPHVISLLLRSRPETDYLYYQILQRLSSARKLEIDTLVMELLTCVINDITPHSPEDEMAASLRKNHLLTIERAKAYLHESFLNDISLMELSAHCCVSPFHFSRIFKKFTDYSPHQYLLTIRLKNAEMLLKNSSLPITDVGFSSGFNSLEHFATAFRQKYRVSPTQYRKGM